MPVNLQSTPYGLLVWSRCAGTKLVVTTTINRDEAPPRRRHRHRQRTGLEIRSRQARQARQAGNQIEGTPAMFFKDFLFLYSKKHPRCTGLTRIEVYKQFVFAIFPPQGSYEVCPAGSRSEKVVTSPPSAHAMVSKRSTRDMSIRSKR